MTFKIKLFGANYPLLPFICSIITCVLLSGLGFWQLDRLSEKNALINKIKINIDTKPVHVSVNDFIQLEKFSKISISGRFAEGKDIFLYGRRSGAPEKDGYYILSPFILENNQTILVSRGWVPHSIKKQIENKEVKLPFSHEIITAIVMPGEKTQFLTPANDISRNIWFNIDLVLAQKIKVITFADFYLRQINNNNIPEGMVSLNADNLSHIRNDHMEYALTWFSLAISIAIMFLVYFRNK